MSQPTTVAVTVTYGDRARLCIAVAETALGCGVRRTIVVDNGSAPESRRTLQRWACGQPRGRAVLIRRPINEGSAGGFGVGIETALHDADADLVWLLDDDTVPEPGALDALLQHRQKLPEPDRPVTALVSLRPERKRLAAVAAGAPWQQVYPTHASFIEVDLLDLLLRRLRRRAGGRPEPQEPVRIPYAPYGGLLLPRPLLEEIGLPLRSLHLYEDDTEFTHRITAAGWEIQLVPTSVVRDQEPSWYTASPGGHFFTKLLTSQASERTYYMVRNRVCFERARWCPPGPTRAINERLVLGLLGISALAIRRRDSFTSLRQAVQEGRRMSEAMT